MTILPDIYSSETSWTLETADADKSNLLTDVKSNIEVIHVENSVSKEYSLNNLGSSNAELKGLDFVQNNNAIQYQMKKNPVQNKLTKSDPGYQFDKLSVWSIPLTRVNLIH